jgi:hypothetical protein
MAEGWRSSSYQSSYGFLRREKRDKIKKMQFDLQNGALL